MAKWTKIDLEVKEKQMESLKLLYGETKEDVTMPFKPNFRHSHAFNNKNTDIAKGSVISAEQGAHRCQGESIQTKQKL